MRFGVILVVLCFFNAHFMFAQDNGFSDEEIRNEAKIRQVAANLAARKNGDHSLPKGKMGERFEEQVIEFVYAHYFLNSNSTLDYMMDRTGGVGKEPFLRAISRVMRGEGRYGHIDIGGGRDTDLINLVTKHLSDGAIPPQGFELSFVAVSIQHPGFCSKYYFKEIERLVKEKGLNASEEDKQEYRQLLAKKCIEMKSQLGKQTERASEFKRDYESLLGLQQALGERVAKSENKGQEENKTEGPGE